jgi:hypothetical protein
LPGAALYLAMLAAAILSHPALRLAVGRRAGYSLAFCSILAAGAAVWFTALQAVVIRRLCPYCLLTHGLAALAAWLGLREVQPGQGLFIYAMFVLTGFVLAQVVWAPTLHRIERVAELGKTSPGELTTENTAGAEKEEAETKDIATEGKEHKGDADAGVPGADHRPAPAPATPPPPVRRLSVVGGRISLSCHLWPLLGNPQARHIIIDMFDYTCHYCRDLHQYLLRAVAERNGELAILLMPLPLDANCNPRMVRTPAEHVNACIYARQALAVFRAAPQSFMEFDQWLLETPKPPPLAEMLARAEQLAGGAGAQGLAAALADPWLAKRMGEALAIYDSAGRGQLPKLLLPRSIVSGPVYSHQALTKILDAELTSPAPS